MTPKVSIILARCEVNDDGCWLWLGQKQGGYGRTSYRGRLWMVHRITYTEIRGEIPSGMQIDHLCMRTSCCNPDHLEVVTQSQNIRRGYATNVTISRQRAKTHCPADHAYSETNTYVWGNGYRQCRQCKREADRRWRARQKMEVA